LAFLSCESSDNLLTNTLYDNRTTDGFLFNLLTSEVQNSLGELQPKKASEISFMDKILGLPQTLFGK